jgi:hypothetical protein
MLTADVFDPTVSTLSKAGTRVPFCDDGLSSGVTPTSCLRANGFRIGIVIWYDGMKGGSKFEGQKSKV